MRRGVLGELRDVLARQESTLERRLLEKLLHVVLQPSELFADFAQLVRLCHYNL
jgi:hypothetical protein